MAICAKCGKEIEGKSWFADDELFQSSKVYHEECAPMPQEEKEKLKKIVKMQEDMKAGKASQVDVVRLLEDIEGSGSGSEKEMEELQKLIDIQKRMKSKAQSGTLRTEDQTEALKALSETEEERRELEKLSRMKKEVPQNKCSVCGAQASNSINGRFYCQRHSADIITKKNREELKKKNEQTRAPLTDAELAEEVRMSQRPFISVEPETRPDQFPHLESAMKERELKKEEERRKKELEEARKLEEQRQKKIIKFQEDQRKREEDENKRKLEEARRLEEARKEMQRKFQAELEAARRRDEEAERKREIEEAKKIQMAVPAIPEFIPPDRFTGSCPYCSHKLKLISKIGGEEEYECTNPNC